MKEEGRVGKGKHEWAFNENCGPLLSVGKRTNTSKLELDRAPGPARLYTPTHIYTVHKHTY